MKLTLSALAPEILGLILSHADKDDRLSLSRTCKRLHQSTLRWIYTTIRWECGQDETANRVYLLLRTLLEYPDLGRFVGHIDFRDHVTYRGAQHSPTPMLGFLTDAEIQMAQARARHLELHPAELWEKALREGNIGAYTVLILSYTPDIQSLLLKGRSIQDPRFLGALLTPTFMRPTPPIGRPPQLSNDYHPPYMSQLRRLYLDPSPTDSFNSHKKASFLREILMVFYFPQLAEVFIDLPAPGRLFRFPSSAPRMDNLTRLHLPFSECPPWVLANLLSSSPPLKTLMYFYNTPQGSDKQTIDVGSLARAMAFVSSTLEILTLSVDFDDSVVDNWPEYYPDGPFDGRLEGLHQCARLTDVDVNLMMVADWHKDGSGPPKLRAKLPENLKKLRLREAGFGNSENDFVVNDLLREVGSLAKKKQVGWYPAWEVLEVERDTTSVMWEEEDVTGMIDVCASVGIEAYVGEFARSPWEDCLQRWLELQI